MITLAQTSEAVSAALNAVDKASAQNDRWLFIATLVVLLGFAAFVVKWLVKSLENKDTAHGVERKELSEKVLAANEKFNVELKQERHDARDQRQADQLAFFNALDKQGADLKVLTESIRANGVLLEQHVREVHEHYRQNTGEVVREELIRLRLLPDPKQPAGA